MDKFNFPDHLQQRSEAFLRKSVLELEQDTSLEKIKQLVQELHLHQIELEMQNEELLRTQLELEKSHHHYTDLFNSLPLGILSIDSEDKIREANLWIANLLGVNRMNLLNQKISHFIAPLSQDTWYFHHQKLFSQACQQQTCSLNLISAKSHNKAVQLRSMPVRDEKQNLSLCRIAVIELADNTQDQSPAHPPTDKDQAEINQFYGPDPPAAEIQSPSTPSAEKRFDLALRATGEAVWECDLVNNTVWWNEAYQQKFGRPPNSRNSWGWWVDHIHPHDRQRVRETLKLATSTDSEYGNRWYVEYAFRLPDDNYAYISDRAYILRDETGKATRIIGVMLDITAQKHARDKLRESEERFQLLLEGVTDYAIFMLDTEGYIISWNQGAEHIYGYQETEILGKHFRCLYGSEKINQEIPAQTLKLAASEGQYLDEGLRRRKDDSQFWASVTITPLRNESGQLRGYVKVTQDISLRIQAESEARHLAAELAHTARLGMMGEMASYLAHELNQPLSAISIYAESCLDMFRADASCNAEECIQAFKEIHAEAQRGTEIIRRTRDFMRKQTSSMKELNVNQLVSETLQFIKPEVYEQKIAFKAKLASNLPDVMADKIELEQVLLNLLRNAIEARDSTNVDTPYKILIQTVLNPDGHIQISIQDTGPGIGVQVEKKIFEPYHTTKPNGLGMGLAISRTIIEKHHGKLWAEPNPDGGAIFYISLPLIKLNK